MPRAIDGDGVDGSWVGGGAVGAAVWQTEYLFPDGPCGDLPGPCVRGNTAEAAGMPGRRAGCGSEPLRRHRRIRLDRDAAYPVPLQCAEGEERLREAYRERYLQSVAPNWLDGSSPRGNWYELVGSAYDRKIYGFQVTTTREQDARLIAAFNDRKNVQTYSGFDSNCADFARNTMNLLYPHMVRRNYVADLGMSSPKSVARSLSHRASKNPEMHFEVFVIPQVAGSLPRSHSPQNLAEGILKRYPVPLVIFSPVSLGVAFAAYVGQGRFSMPKDAQRLDVSDIGVKPSVLVEPGGGGPGGLAGNSNRIARPFPEQALTLPPPSSTLVLSVVQSTARVPAETMTENSAGSRALVRVGVLQ